VKKHFQQFLKQIQATQSQAIKEAEKNQSLERNEDERGGSFSL